LTKDYGHKGSDYNYSRGLIPLKDGRPISKKGAKKLLHSERSRYGKNGKRGLFLYEIDSHLVWAPNRKAALKEIQGYLKGCSKGWRKLD